MSALRHLPPKEAAEFVLDDIRNDADKLKKLSGAPLFWEDMRVGMFVLESVYKIPINGPIDFLTEELAQKLYIPLQFQPVAHSTYELPTECKMIEHLGTLVRIHLSSYF